MAEEITMKPRVSIKKSTLKNGIIGWEIASSSHEDEGEIKKIVEMLTKIHKNLEKNFWDEDEEGGGE